MKFGNFLQKKVPAEHGRSRRSGEHQGEVFSVIFDVGNNTIVATSHVPAAIALASESLLDTGFFFGVNAHDTQILKDTPSRALPEWTWNLHKHSITKTPGHIITEDMRDRAALAASKVSALIFVIHKINEVRRKMRSGFAFQNDIYAQKRSQAQLLKQYDYDISRAHEAPYVVQDAEERNISLRESAEGILLQAELTDEYFLRTEKARISTLKAIKNAPNVAAVEQTLQTFRSWTLL